MPWLVGLAAPILSGIMKHFFTKLFTDEVAERVFIDIGWYLAKKSNNDLAEGVVNTAAKALEYKYKPELDK